MADRRDFIGYIGTGAIGSIVGYYVGAQKLLGIQSETETAPRGTETAPRGTETAPQGTETAPQGTETAPRETETAPRGTETAQTDALLDEDFSQGLTDWEVVNPSGWEDRNTTPAEVSESDRFGGSIKTTVDGAPSGVRFNRFIRSVPSGTTISLEMYSPTYTNSAQIGSAGGGIVIALQSQTAGDTRIWKLGDSGKRKLAENDGHGRFSATIPDSSPEDTTLSIWTKTWPGRVTFFYKNVTMSGKN